jgi:hypothetical protein
MEIERVTLLSIYLLDQILKHISPKPVLGKSYNHCSTVVENCGIEYWYNLDFLTESECMLAVQKNVSSDVGLDEAKSFITSYIEKIIAPVIANMVFEFVECSTLYELINIGGKITLKVKFDDYASNYIQLQTIFFPLGPFDGLGFDGISFSFVDTSHFEKNSIPTRFLNTPLFLGVEKWLALRARNKGRSIQVMETVLGALASALHPHSRFLFNGIEPRNGIFTDKGTVHSGGIDRCLPPLMDKVILRPRDVPWLVRLDTIIINQHKNLNKIRSLRYYFFSWHAQNSERYSFLCMALEALIPAKEKGQRDKCIWVREALCNCIDLHVIELLLISIRNDILHGDAASIPESVHYNDFISKYANEPILVLDEITTSLIDVICFDRMSHSRPHKAEEDPAMYKMLMEYFSRQGMPQKIPSRFKLNDLHKGILSKWEKPRT